MRKYHPEYRSLKRSIGSPETLSINKRPKGHAHLALLTNNLKTTPILVFAERQISRGELVAVDIDAAFIGTRDQERHVLMILSVPPGGAKSGRALHRFGISSSVFVPKDGDVENAFQFNGHVWNSPLERYTVGGKTCWHCSSERSNGIVEIQSMHEIVRSMSPRITSFDIPTTLREPAADIRSSHAMNVQLKARVKKWFRR
jgi:hypothetical protein